MRGRLVLKETHAAGEQLPEGAVARVANERQVAHAGQIEQVIMNLTVNSRDAMAKSSIPEGHDRCRPAANNIYIVIRGSKGRRRDPAESSGKGFAPGGG